MKVIAIFGTDRIEAFDEELSGVSGPIRMVARSRAAIETTGGGVGGRTGDGDSFNVMEAEE